MHKDKSMRWLDKIFFILKKYINYLYYLNSTFSRNSYPCKLIGEKLNSTSDEPIIIFKILGKVEKYSIPLINIFFNKNLIASFSPKDSLKLGRIAFNFIINNKKENDKLKTFYKIKEIMLSSVHDIFSGSHFFSKSTPANLEAIINIDIESYLISLISRNKYPFKLVGYKSLNKTIIIYTIFGKRDGYQKTLNSLINTNSVLDKFHPTEAVKFGFISAGEEFLT
jgi:hypothetical protein